MVTDAPALAKKYAAVGPAIEAPAIRTRSGDGDAIALFGWVGVVDSGKHRTYQRC